MIEKIIDDYVPSEEEMRAQTFKTMSALEGMAKAVTDHLTADKQPCKQTQSKGMATYCQLCQQDPCKCPRDASGRLLESPLERSFSSVVDYSTVRAVCRVCEGIACYKSGWRDSADNHDSCTCEGSDPSRLNAPPYVEHAIRSAARGDPPQRMYATCDGSVEHEDAPPVAPKCSACNGSGEANTRGHLCWACGGEGTKQCTCGDLSGLGPHSKTSACGCPACHGGLANAECICPQPPTSVEPEALATIIEAQCRHRKALALLSTFATFTDAGFFCGTKPASAIARLIKLKACSCVGTGWVARDETCKECGGSGYIKP